MCAKSLESCTTLCDPIDCSPPGSSVHGDSPGKNTGVRCMPTSKGSSQPWDPTQSLALQEDSLPSDLPERPQHGNNS